MAQLTQREFRLAEKLTRHIFMHGSLVKSLKKSPLRERQTSEALLPTEMQRGAMGDG